MTRVRFEPKISAGEQPQTDALDHAATGTGKQVVLECVIVLYAITTNVSITVIVTMCSSWL
jgi:hypothetical protein